MAVPRDPGALYNVVQYNKFVYVNSILCVCICIYIYIYTHIYTYNANTDNNIIIVITYNIVVYNSRI